MNIRISKTHNYFDLVLVPFFTCTKTKQIVVCVPRARAKQTTVRLRIAHLESQVGLVLCERIGHGLLFDLQAKRNIKPASVPH